MNNFSGRTDGTERSLPNEEGTEDNAILWSDLSIKDKLRMFSIWSPFIILTNVF